MAVLEAWRIRFAVDPPAFEKAVLRRGAAGGGAIPASRRNASRPVSNPRSPALVLTGNRIAQINSYV